jgi:hypothetical protein
MINKFEQPAMKKIFGAPRARLGVRGKKRKGAKPVTHLSVPVAEGGKTIETATILASKHPLWFMGLVMYEPTLIRPGKLVSRTTIFS